MTCNLWDKFVPYLVLYFSELFVPCNTVYQRDSGVDCTLLFHAPRRFIGRFLYPVVQSTSSVIRPELYPVVPFATLAPKPLVSRCTTCHKDARSPLSSFCTTHCTTEVPVPCCTANAQVTWRRDGAEDPPRRRRKSTRYP